MAAKVRWVLQVPGSREALGQVVLRQGEGSCSFIPQGSRFTRIQVQERGGEGPESQVSSPTVFLLHEQNLLSCH